MQFKRVVILFLLFKSVLLAQQTEYYIAPDGRDTNPGSIKEPFSSLEKARDTIRQSKTNDPITVFLRQGTYYLSKTFVLTAEDSGKKEAPVLYRAYPGEQVVLSGGMKLALKWEPYRDGIFQAKTPEGLQIDQLFVNGQRQHMARYPNYDANARPYNGAAADAFSPSRAAGWADPTGGYIHAMHRSRWGGYHYRITGKKENNEVTYEGGWQNNRQSGMHNEYRFVENIFEELDAPGEWFNDSKKHTLYYMPDKDIDVKTALFEVVVLSHLVEFQGTQEKPIRCISLAGLTFRHAARTFMETKEPLLRSDWTIYRGGTVLLTGAEDCTISDCEFDQVGGNSIFVSNYNRRITIRGCHIQGSGASGVCFVGNPDSVRNPRFEYGQKNDYDKIDKTPGPKTDNYPADCLVDDCLIHNVSVVEKQATGVQISMSRRITVRHCSVYDVGRAGINISEGTFGGHIIEFCDVFDTVRETGDHGSFNSWGRDRFWHLNNAPDDELPKLALLDAELSIIRNSRWRCDHGWDIDLDDGSSSYHLYNNLCLNGGIKLREGFHRICENNIMVNNSFHPHVWYTNSQDIFRHNIVFANYKPIRVPTPWGKQCDYNLLHDLNVSEIAPAASLQKQSKLDEHSITANAMFMNPAKGDYRVADNSPALKLGFKNFPMDQFGVLKPELKAIAKTPILPEVKSSASAEKSTRSDKIHRWLGAEIKNIIGLGEISATGLHDETGVWVMKIPAGSIAEKIGFQENDVILQWNDINIDTVDDLLTNYKKTLDNKTVTIAILRDQGKCTLISDCTATGEPPAITTAKIPDEVRAQEIKNMKWGMFICWSFSTFSGQEWTPTTDKDAAYFKAAGCDTDQWCETAKAAGMNYILFLTKHHDGFCLWDTATTDKKVTHSPLGIDVLAKLRKSCDKYGLKLALYFSEGDWNWPGAKDGKGGAGGGSNPQVKKAQLEELLTHYGPIEFWWMDHAVGDGGLSHEETVEWMCKFQPNTFVGFNHGQPAGRICLRERGRPGELGDPKAASPHNKASEIAGHKYLVAEFTYPILPEHTGGAMWFYSLPIHDGLCKSAESVYADYAGAVKYGNIFSLNIGPDYKGRIRDIDVKTLKQVGQMIRDNAPLH